MPLVSFISIHAPTRGATKFPLPCCKLFVDFNPRSHERSDPCWHLSSTSNQTFQSTLPREERRVKLCICPSSHLFQSTLPREERLYFFSKAPSTSIISIHAPTRGATSTTSVLVSSLYSFQSTLPREERQHPQCRLLSQVYFNPRSHERSDDGRIFSKSRKVISIHAPTRGATNFRFAYLLI